MRKMTVALSAVLAVAVAAAGYVYWPSKNRVLEFAMGTVTLTEKACKNPAILAQMEFVRQMGAPLRGDAKAGSLVMKDGKKFTLCYSETDRPEYVFVVDETGDMGAIPVKKD